MSKESPDRMFSVEELDQSNDGMEVWVTVYDELLDEKSALESAETLRRSSTLGRTRVVRHTSEVVAEFKE